mgnify:CR=1 FL=1
MSVSLYAERLRKFEPLELEQFRNRYVEDVFWWSNNLKLTEEQFEALDDEDPLRKFLSRVNVHESRSNFNDIFEYIEKKYGKKLPLTYDGIRSLYYVAYDGKKEYFPADKFSYELDCVYYICEVQEVESDFSNYEAGIVRSYLKELLGEDDIDNRPVHLNEQQRFELIKMFAEKNAEDEYLFDDKRFLTLIYSMILYPDDLFLEVQY